MCVGEKAILISSPEHGYGRAGMPPMIKPNAHLWYEVELMASLKLTPSQYKLVGEETDCLRTISRAQEEVARRDSSQYRRELQKMISQVAPLTASIDKIFASQK